MLRTTLLTVAVLSCGVCLMAAQPTSKPASTSAPSKVTIDQSSPKALLLSTYQAAEANDHEALVRCTDPALKPIMDAGMEIQKTTKHLFDVMDRKLGRAADECKRRATFFSDPALASPLASAVSNGKVDWAKVRIDEKNDQATVVIGRTTLKAKRIDGKWYWASGKDLTTAEIRDATIGAIKTLSVVKSVAAKLEDGLQDGSITKANFDEHLKQLVEKSGSRGVAPAAPSRQ